MGVSGCVRFQLCTEAETWIYTKDLANMERLKQENAFFAVFWTMKKLQSLLQSHVLCNWFEINLGILEGGWLFILTEYTYTMWCGFHGFRQYTIQNNILKPPRGKYIKNWKVTEHNRFSLFRLIYTDGKQCHKTLPHKYHIKLHWNSSMPCSDGVDNSRAV